MRRSSIQRYAGVSCFENFEPRRLLAAIASGQTVTGSIGLAEIDSYTFTAAAGDSIRAAVADTGNTNFTPQIELYAPNGTRLTWDFEGVGTSLTALSVASGGTYTMVVSDYGSNDTGNYSITMVKTPAATHQHGSDGGAIASGETRGGAIAAGDLDVFTFYAAAGDSIRAAVGDTSNTNFTPQIELYAPNGTRVTWDFEGVGTDVTALSITQSGTYTIVVSDYGSNDTGNYSLSMARAQATVQRFGADDGSIVSGQTRNGSVGLGDIDVFTFYATAGDTIRAALGDRSNSNFTPQIELYAPNGTRLTWDFDGVATDISALSIAQSGEYTLVVTDYGSNDAGTYNLTLSGSIRHRATVNGSLCSTT